MNTGMNGDNCHDILNRECKGRLAFREDCDFPQWQKAVREKLHQLLGLDVIAENACPVETEIQETVETETYTRIRFRYLSERGNAVPAYLLIPRQGSKRHPLAIVLQGHTTGFHNSVGILKYDQDKHSQPDDCFGLQAVENGFAALCIEQRGMGEVRSPRYPGPGGVHQCSFTAMTALNLGRTIIGERVWDVSRGIDALNRLAFAQIDTEKIMILGNSGGGTAAFYAACCDERIGYAVPGCSFCSFRTSIMDILHCVCNNIPGISRWFEMEDLAGLIAPRRLTVLAGQHDEIFPLDGVKDAFAAAEAIYAKAGAPGCCRLTVMPKDHHWCPDEAWKTIREETAVLGW